MRVLLFSVLLFAASTLPAQQLAPALVERLDARLNQSVEGMAPGLAVGVVRDGQVIFERYLGYANLEHEVPIDAHSRFNIASNAKQFTALMVLQQMQAGQLQLEQDIRVLLPDYFTELDTPITVKDLLSHRSGVRDVYDLWALQGHTWWRLFVDNEDALELLQAQQELNFTPNSDTRYSNSNYLLLTALLEAVSDDSFASLAAGTFAQLGMQESAFQTHYMAVVPHKARPYGSWNGWREYPQVTALYGDGGLFTTLPDQLRWEQLLQQDQATVLPLALLQESQQPLANGQGYGLMFGRYKGQDYVYHDGNTGAYNASFMRFPEQRLAVVVMSNNGNLSTRQTAQALVDLILDLPPGFPAGPDRVETGGDLQALPGVYQTDGGDLMMITQRDGDLYRELAGAEPVRLIPERGGLYQYASRADLKMNFSQIGTARQQLTIYLPSQPPISYRRLALPEPVVSAPEDLNGRYYNAETDTEILIRHDGDQAYTVTKNGRAREAQLLLPDRLQMNSYQLRVVRDAEQQVQGLRVDNRRIRNVWFVRS